MEPTTIPPEHQQVHWRIPAKTHDALTDFAERTHRSRNGAAVHLIERGLDADAEPRPTSWGHVADARWNVFRGAVQRGATTDEAAELAGLPPVNEAL